MVIASAPPESLATAPRVRDGTVLAAFTAALLASAAVLFVAEPMTGRLLLPRAGSTPAVWNTSLVFFQAALLTGYAYAHFSARWLRHRTQVAVQIGLLLAAALVLPLRLPASWSPPVDSTPVFWQLGVMALIVGLPFVVVSASAPLLQHWFGAAGHLRSRDPYHLYRASNLGSAIALVGYPLIVEPALGLRAQGIAWAVAYGLVVVLTAGCAGLVLRRRSFAPGVAQADAEPAAPGGSVTRKRRLRWIATAAVPSAWLLAVTTHLTTEIAPIPLLWVVPLGIYLLSFTLAFGTWRRLRQRHLVRVLPFALILLVGTLVLRATGPFSIVALIHLSAFGLAATLCHRELAEDRPAAARLTDFYLSLAVGGVLGGIAVAIVVPLVASGYIEYPLAVVCLCLLLFRHATRTTRSRWLDVALPAGLGVLTAALAAISVHGISDVTEQRVLTFGVPAAAAFAFSRRPVRFGLALGAILLATSLPLASAERELFAARDYFGVHRVVLSSDSRLHVLYDGAIVHGAQATGPHRNDPLTYYTRSGALGDIMASSALSRVRTVGVIGLGAGSMACYARPGQTWRFFEIDPVVVRIAENPALFTFLRDCLPGSPAVVLGDARLELQRTSERFDMLATDAFGGDVIPTHLLTREAMQVDLQHLAPHGMLVFHISNQHADLSGVLGNLAADRSLCAYQRIDGDISAAHAEPGKFASQWVAMGRTCADLGDLPDRDGWHLLPPRPDQRLWTDDYSAILQVLRWNS